MATEEPELIPQGKSSKKPKLLILMAAVAVLLLGGGGAFAWHHFHQSASHSKVPAADIIQPMNIVIPTIMSNLDSGDGRPRYVRVSARLQLADGRDAEKVLPLMPEIQNAFQSYLHETRPDELSGSGIYRLREALLTQIANIVAPIRVRDLFFVELLVQ